MDTHKIDIAFITSPNNWGVNHPPFFYMALAAWLEREGYRCEIIDEKISRNPFLIISEKLRNKVIIQRVIRKIKRSSPKYIGLAVFTTDYKIMMEIAKEIKNNFDIPIIVGNAHAAISPEDFIFKGSPIDYAVIGEGEITLTELIDTLDQNSNLKQVNGIAYLKNDEICLTSKRALIQDLQVLPMPAYHKINMKYYLRPRLYLIRFLPVRGIAIYTGRGCPFQCEFCCSNLIWKSHDKTKFVRTAPIDSVIKELRFLKNNYDIDAFYIMDDTFTLNKKRSLEFCEKLIKSNLELIWAVETRVNLIDEEMIKIMKEAGCIQIDFGVESGSQRLLDKIKKGITIKEIKRAFKLCNENGIRTFATMLLNLPTETEDDLKKSELLLEEIKATSANFQITIPYPGTALYEKYIFPKPNKEEYDLFKDRYVDVERFKMASHALNLQNILPELTKKYERTNPGYFIRNKQLKRKVFKSKKIISYFKESIQFVILHKFFS